MKKLLLIFILAALLVACSGAGEESVPNPETAAMTVGAAAETTETADSRSGAPVFSGDGYVCALDNGVTIRLGAEAAEQLAPLGEPTDTMEAPSCIYDGFDKVLTFDGAYTVTTTAAADGREYVTELSLLSDAVALTEGDAWVMIGSSEDVLAAAFGEPAEDAFGVKKYELAGGVVTATVNGGEVTGLTVAYPVN